jgi:hypothetical protein
MVKMIRKYKLFSMIITIAFVTMSCEDILTGLIDGDSREKLTGSWLCDESEGYLKAVAETYRVEIYLHPDDSSKVLIFNFFNLDPDISAEATLSGSRLSLYGQTLEGGFMVSGSGIISKNYTQIDWEYSVNDGSGENYEMTAVYTKQ